MATVYLYYFPSRRAAAEAAGAAFWNCKVGHTTRDVQTRVGEQCSGDEAPEIALVIASPRSRELERAIHVALRLRGRAVETAPGREWFRTSPDEVAAVYRSIIAGADNVPRGEALRRMENKHPPRPPTVASPREMDESVMMSIRHIAPDICARLGAGEVAIAAFVTYVTPLLRAASEDLIRIWGQEAHVAIVDAIFFAATQLEALDPLSEDSTEDSTDIRKIGIMYGAVTGSPAISFYTEDTGIPKILFVDRESRDGHVSDLPDAAVDAMDRLVRRRGFAIWRAPPPAEAAEPAPHAHRFDLGVLCRAYWAIKSQRPGIPSDVAALARLALVTEVRFAGTEAGWFQREYSCAKGDFRGRWTPLSDSELERRLVDDVRMCCESMDPYPNRNHDVFLHNIAFRCEVIDSLRILCLETDPNRWAE